MALINNIASAMYNRESTAGVFVDLSKAFDTIDHHILLNKLDHYGIRGHSFNWVSSYLTNRKQLVQFTACSMFSTGTNKRYLYSPTALGRETSQRDCEAKAGNFLAKTQTNIG